MEHLRRFRFVGLDVALWLCPCALIASLNKPVFCTSNSSPVFDSFPFRQAAPAGGLSKLAGWDRYNSAVVDPDASSFMPSRNLYDPSVLFALVLLYMTGNL